MTTEFKVPKKCTAAHKVIELLRNVGALTRPQIVEAMELQGMKKDATVHAVTHMREMGWADLKDKKYSISFALRRYLDMCETAPKFDEEITPARTAPEKRPLSSKYIPSLNPLLQGRFRTDVGFKNGGIDFVFGYRA